MKRTKRQLVLTRETIRPLGALALGNVAGAVVDSKGGEIAYSCACTPGTSGETTGGPHQTR